MDENETTNEQAIDQQQAAEFGDPKPVIAAQEPQVDAFGLPPVARPVLAEWAPGEMPERADTVDRFGQPLAPSYIDPPAQPFTAALHPDDATARCAEILDNMHGSDDQRRKVVQALVERFGS